MSISQKCDKCMEELEVPGGLAFSPPDDDFFIGVEKYHICLKCWVDLKSWINGNSPFKEIAEQLKRLGLEPWTDGRSILDGKRPVDQHIAMVISSLIAERDDYKVALEEIRGIGEISAEDPGTYPDRMRVQDCRNIAKDALKE